MIEAAAIASNTSFLFAMITIFGFIVEKTVLDTSTAKSIVLSAHILVVFNVSGQSLK
jgi:hypothetical protein